LIKNIETNLHYGEFDGYNNPKNNERRAELPIAFWFISMYYNNLIEVGEVTPFYAEVTYDVYDPSGEKPNTKKIDGFDIDYTNKNVLSISTVEHIGRGDYGFPVVPHQALEYIKLVKSQCNKFLITFPIGYNRELEEDLILDNQDFFIVERDSINNWKTVDHKDFSRYEYNSPYYAGNAIAVLTNTTFAFNFS